MKEVKVFKNLADLSLGCAEFVFQEIRMRMHNNGKVDCVLSGGRTPELCYRNLASLLDSESALVNGINWFFGDERWVPVYDNASNAGLIKKLLLNSLDVPEDRVHTWHACEKDQFKCADDYNRLMERLFIDQGRGADILLLGMGNDGHTASLFPDAVVLREEGEFDAISPDITQNAVAVYVTAIENWRLTLTPNFINRAGCIIFLISGEKKQESFRKIINGDDKLPASWIKGKNVYYFITQDIIKESMGKEPESWPLTISLQN
ncbi:MAG: 6-phosphogluconolactonase [Spirochaetales bacterium]|nr:6-phosphogluconolactonase [Spirochaetales bacterium]